MNKAFSILFLTFLVGCAGGRKGLPQLEAITPDKEEIVAYAGVGGVN